jgi:adenylate cyclase
MLPFLRERAMARVFLSYARDDAATAKSIAKAIECAGHQGWWDSSVHGGAQFDAEIAEAFSNLRRWERC